MLLHENVGYLPYSPLAGGVLTGKYIDGTATATSRFMKWGKERYPRYLKEGVQTAVKAYIELAKSKGMSATTLALAFVNEQAFNTANIIGATTLSHLKENIASTQTTLDKATLAAINEIHYRAPNPTEGDLPSKR